MRKRNLFPGVALLCASIAGGAYAEAPAQAQVCAACHGADGNSINPIWPSLAGQNAGYLIEQMEHFKAGVRENASMAPMVAGLEPADMEALATWFAAQAPRIQAVAAEDITNGQKLYRGGDAARGVPACMACHGPGGAGNAAAKYPALRGQHADYTVLQLKAYRDGTRATDPNAMMRTVAARLSDDDMLALARYISGLH
jgi:cytochrome c553